MHLHLGILKGPSISGLSQWVLNCTNGLHRMKSNPVFCKAAYLLRCPHGTIGGPLAINNCLCNEKYCFVSKNCLSLKEKLCSPPIIHRIPRIILLGVLYNLHAEDDKDSGGLRNPHGCFHSARVAFPATADIRIFLWREELAPSYF